MHHSSTTNNTVLQQKCLFTKTDGIKRNVSARYSIYRTKIESLNSDFLTNTQQKPNNNEQKNKTSRPCLKVKNNKNKKDAKINQTTGCPEIEYEELKGRKNAPF